MQQTRVLCYTNVDLHKDQRYDESLHFIDFWNQLTGNYPKELIFDTKLTTYHNLSRLNQIGIGFITLRRRSKNMLSQVFSQLVSAWRRIELIITGASRI
jgi:hypothetical protein